MHTVGRRPILIALLSVACTPTLDVELSIRPPALADAIDDVRVFAFDRDADPTARCRVFEPRGAPPGDAEARTGRSAVASSVGGLADGEVARVAGVPRGATTLVVEGWSSGAQPVLRSYACRTVDTHDGIGLDSPLVLGWLVGPLATIQLPEGVENVPRHVADEAPAEATFAVSLRDGEAQGNVMGAPVFWGVTKGVGRLSSGTRTTSVTTGMDGHAAMSAAAGARASGAGMLEVTAYAAGFAGGPIHFELQPRPTVAASLRTVAIPRTVATFPRYADDHDSGPREGDPRDYFRPVVAEDFDRDGRVDVAFTAGGTADHQLVVAYGGADERWDLYASERVARTAVAMARYRVAPDEPVGLIMSSAQISAVRSGGGHLEVWRPPAGRPSATEGWSVTAERSASIAIDLHAADVDGRGPDELVAASCRRVDDIVGRCAGATGVDNHLRLYSRRNDRFVQTSTASDPIFGGYRSARFVDLDGDGALDLVAVAGSHVHAFCSSAGALDLTARGQVLGARPDAGLLAVGRFDDDSRGDIAFAASGTSGSRAPDAVVAAFRGCLGCSENRRLSCGLEESRALSHVGRRSYSMATPAAALDVDGDGLDDVLVLHRYEHRLNVFFAAGDGDLVAGPRIDLPARDIGGLAVANDAELGPVAFTIDTAANAMIVIRFETP